jgi:hypothetical protein
MNISRHFAVLQINTVSVSKPGSPVTEIGQDLDSRSEEEMLEFMTTPPGGDSKPIVVRLTEVDAQALEFVLYPSVPRNSPWPCRGWLTSRSKIRAQSIK